MSLRNICVADLPLRADRVLALMLWLACYGCSASDEQDKTGAQEQSSQPINDDGGSGDGDASVTESTRADKPSAVDRSSAGAGSAKAAFGCERNEDCTALGPEYVGGRCASNKCSANPRWRCESPPTASASDTMTLTLPVIDSLQLSPVADVAIAACDLSDDECKQPVASATSDQDGKATLKVPASFTGYLQQTESSDYVPALYFMPARWPADGVLSNFPLVPSAAFSGLALALGTSLDRSRGHAMLIVEDCTGAALSGISFSSPQADSASIRFYVKDQLPSTAASGTSPAGDGGYVNLPAGALDITATDPKTGLVLNTVKGLIRAGHTTTVYIRPAARGE